jgi:hypothetical protein
MFELDVDDRLARWSKFRKSLETSDSPMEDVIEFWSTVPIISHNHDIDHYYSGNWPTPWEIIGENRYDDFTKAIMMGYTLLLTDRFKKSNVQIRTFVDKSKNRLYNTTLIDDTIILNFYDDRSASENEIPDTCVLENIIELTRPR